MSRSCEAKIASITSASAGTSAIPLQKLTAIRQRQKLSPMLLLRRPLCLYSRLGLRPVMVTASAGAVGDNKRKMVRIGTHSGSFHCDEALGCFLLRQTNGYKDAEIVRTRDESVLSELDIVIDVGGSYDAGAHNADPDVRILTNMLWVH